MSERDRAASPLGVRSPGADVVGTGPYRMLNPHSRAKSGLTALVELVDNTKSGERRANGLAHGNGTEVRMPEDRTAPVGEQWFEWTVEGESYHQGSRPLWRSEAYSSAITAETAGEALEKIITGLGEGTTGDNTIPWDMIEQDREITITIKPRDVDMPDVPA